MDIEKYGQLYDKNPDAPAIIYRASKRYPVFAGVEGLEVVCKFTKKYNMPPMLVKDDVLEWATKYPALNLLWLWTPHFADHHGDGLNLSRAIQKIVQVGTKAVFFVSERESAQGGNFWFWHQRLTYGSGIAEVFREKTAVIPVPEEAGMWNVSDVVLANPHIGPTHGVLIHGQIAVEIYQPELANNMKVMLMCADLCGKTKEAFL